MQQISLHNKLNLNPNQQQSVRTSYVCAE